DFHVTGVQTCALPIYKPLFQTQSVWLNDAEGQACLSIRPDLLIYKAAADKGAYLGLGQKKNQDDIEVSESESAGNCSLGHYSHEIGRASCRERVEITG